MPTRKRSTKKGSHKKRTRKTRKLSDYNRFVKKYAKENKHHRGTELFKKAAAAWRKKHGTRRKKSKKGSRRSRK
jgi:hypothetical protein